VKLYSEESLEKIYESYYDLIPRVNRLQTDFILIADELRDEAKDHALYGISRRLSIIKECVEYFFQAIPPEQNEEIDIEVRKRGDIHLHAILINVCGIIDNMAWLWAYHIELDNKIDLEKKKSDIGMFNKKFRKHLPDTLKEKTSTFSDWYNFIKNQRHPTAHRIPPYIIPYIQSSDTGLNDYTPTYVHSTGADSRPVYLHAQTLNDVGVIIELLEDVRCEIGRKKQTQSF
jgi:hypothetical protein